MSYMRMGAMALFSSLFLAACVPTSGYVVQPWNPWGIATPTPAPPVSYTDVYKYQGSRQCEGGGVPLEEMKRQLEASGVIVTATSCGMDGRMYPAFCGGADGRINVFTINSNSMNAALSQGFSPLSSLPGAQKGSCYVSNNSGTSTTYPYNNNGAGTAYPYSGGGSDASYYSYQ
ncbi:hypothetical protein VSS37_02240 [Candidatus Thiothrix sp. Deng01]|uniref:Lipoprotein n=1 Tax=Candidatus Thiothrix phosphatis TaxID=3112415 RepID=A0ABU6CUG5_9GAMM|nr:hypothetical protein [Candidatus Thiothrix sp. Deng01]MEB4589789.1 hypothetical protein [Candidatus Thiothrix sp. Deng01]